MTEEKVEQEVQPAEVKKRGPSRLLILLLFGVLVAAGTYFYGGDLLAPEAPVAVVAPKKPGKIKVPVRHEQQVVEEKVPEVVVPREEVAKVEPPDLPPAEKKKAPAPKVVPAPAAEEDTSPAKIVARPVFALSSGSYLYSGALNAALAQLEQRGYEVRRSEKKETHQMTRLRVGVYARPEAEKRLAEVTKLAEGAFMVAEKGRLAVYAGSFISLDRARRVSDFLYQKGLRLDEIQVPVELSKTTLQFGAFSSRAEAEQAAAELKKHGVLNPQIVSLR